MYRRGDDVWCGDNDDEEDFEPQQQSEHETDSDDESERRVVRKSRAKPAAAKPSQRKRRRTDPAPAAASASMRYMEGMNPEQVSRGRRGAGSGDREAGRSLVQRNASSSIGYLPPPIPPLTAPRALPRKKSDRHAALK